MTVIDPTTDILQALFHDIMVNEWAALFKSILLTSLSLNMSALSKHKHDFHNSINDIYKSKLDESQTYLFSSFYLIIWKWQIWTDYTNDLQEIMMGI